MNILRVPNIMPLSSPRRRGSRAGFPTKAFGNDILLEILKKNNSAILLFLVVIMSLIFSGCMHLQKSFPDIKTYCLDAGSGEHAVYAGPVISVRLNPVSAVSQFADRYLTYRTDEIRYESDFYNQLMASPAVMIKDQAQVWLRGSSAIEFVLTTDDVTNPYYLIDGKVLEFYGDYRKTDQPEAVLKIEWTVSKSAPEGIKALFQKVYSGAISIPEISPSSLVAGWDRALVKIMSEFEGDLSILARKSKNK